ncbi:MAG: MerR family transcriptional regulator, thiopeptide resistance regulator [Thermoleophilaceae bacterium]|nr:MerR family transcriptional regulator, thiopeptide resistance regulator [Thermoleophilaceae bacterium]
MRIGELADATGMTVRALRHYHEVGLLVPSERSEAGYRLYSHGDVQRLFRIRALRRLGLGLDEVRAALDADRGHLRDVVAGQLERVERDLELQARLRRRLEQVLAQLDAGGEPSSEQLLDTIEVMTMTDGYYTPEQRAQLDERARDLGPDGMERAQREWAELIAAADEERRAGTDPSDPRVQELATRWQALIEQFTGGDPGIRASLERMYSEQGPQKASRGMVDPELMAYMARAREAGA